MRMYQKWREGNGILTNEMKRNEGIIRWHRFNQRWWKTQATVECWNGWQVIQGQRWRDTCSGIANIKIIYWAQIQYLHPLELHCDVEKQPSSVNTNTSILDANAKEYLPRRTVAVIAEIRMKDISNDKSNNDHQHH